MRPLLKPNSVQQMRPLLKPNSVQQLIPLFLKQPTVVLTQQHLLSHLLEHPNRDQAIQIHSHLIKTGTRPWKIIWNTLLRVYSQGLFPNEAFKLYNQISPFFWVHADTFTYSFLLKACSNLDQPIQGAQLHAQTIKVGFECHVYVGTSLVDMYLVCGFLREGIKMFEEMPDRNLVVWGAMITGLTKWGELDLARRFFDEMPCRSVVSWTGIIDGYARANQFKEAVSLFRQMMMIDGLKPNEITVLTILPAVWNLGDLYMSESIHAYSEKHGFSAFDIRVINSLIDVYSKCGSVENAFTLFEEVSSKRKNLVTWTSMISGFAMHGMTEQALKHFQEMEKEGLKPNRVTFISVLHACSHGGLVKEGLMFFDKMVNGYQIMPGIKHYGCMIDMLGRVGMLEEAEKMAMEIPLEMVNAVVWRTLLGACSFHGNAEMGERAMKKILELERGYAGDYVLLSNIYAGVGKFSDSEKVRSLIDDQNGLKVPGLSLIDFKETG